MAVSTQSVHASLASTESFSHWKHDVFLSFRGADTRSGITTDLYHELKNRGIQTFMDDQGLQKGMTISPSLQEAIEESRCAIVILSLNYASSAWCLDELTKILQCSEAKKSMVVPIFYKVDPSHVRHQTGSFAEAFAKHEERCQQGNGDVDLVKKWRVALTQVANLSGWDLNKFGSDRELVKRIVEHVCSNVQPISLVSSGDFETFEATKQAMEELWKAIKNDGVTIIAVYGMGGVGKTTMVKHVGAQSQKRGLFHHVIMAVLTQTPDLRQIQDTLGEMLGLKFFKETVTGRADALRKKIKSGHKMLIILDDMWDRADLSSIGIPSCKELQRSNSKVILTTRRLHVCNTMECQANIPLSILSEEDAWTLFVKKTRKSFEEDTDFYDVARKVAIECAGLPIALTAVARALGDKKIGAWKEALRRLQMSQSANPDEKDVFKCIKLSYDYLVDNDAKFCFLLCCLFPEDDDIQIEDLMKYGYGIGLFQDVDSTIENARDMANSVTEHLIASSLLLDGAKVGCVRMHDVIRDTAMVIASSAAGHMFFVRSRRGLEDWPVDAHEGYTAISLMYNNIHKLPQVLVCPKLQILLLNWNKIKEIPNRFFQSANDIRVLDLLGHYISKWPSSFSLLANLHVLRLDFIIFGTGIDMSLLRKLTKLEILSMRGYRNKKFPIELGKLTNLRMLDLSQGWFRTVPSGVMSRLHRLEELYMQYSFWDWGRRRRSPHFGHKNANFDELVGLSRLNILEVNICGAHCLPEDVERDPNWVNFDILISRDNAEHMEPYLNVGFRRCHSRALTLDTTMNTLPGWFINAVTMKAERLYYIRCDGLSDLLEEHDRGKLRKLKYLSIDCSRWPSDLEVLFNTLRWKVSDKTVFEYLEELCIKSMHRLKELCTGELPLLSLHRLKILIVEQCNYLVNSLLSSNLLHRLQNLENLCCSFSRMEYLFGFEGIEPQQIILANLREISLHYVDSLINIWSGPAPHGIFHHLKRFSVHSCNGLKYLFTPDVAQGLLQLDFLSVSDCNSLETVIQSSDQSESNNKITLPELKKLVLKCLPRLKTLSCTGSTSTHVGIKCPSLEFLYVEKCPRFSKAPASVFQSKKEVHVYGGVFFQ